MTTLLIDTDIICYQTAAACEMYIEDPEGDWVEAKMDKRQACAELDSFIDELKTKLNADKVIMALTDANNFRKSILATYKANRAGQRKPVGLTALKKYVAESYETFIRPGLEADDILGILATHPSIVADDKIVVSIDKDLKSIPGKIYNWNTGELKEISENEANYWHMYQTLTGDSTDGYSGCPGIGPVKAEALLSANSDWWSVVCAAFRKAKLSVDEALTQARVARILRADDYDFVAKRPILWTPKAVANA